MRCCHDHAIIEEFAREGSIPVVNALTDFLHPCQIYTDAFSMIERWSDGPDLMDSLKSMKRYFLLDQGDFLVHFLDAAEDELLKELGVA